MALTHRNRGTIGFRYPGDPTLNRAAVILIDVLIDIDQKLPSVNDGWFEIVHPYLPVPVTTVVVRHRYRTSDAWRTRTPFHSIASASVLLL